MLIAAFVQGEADGISVSHVSDGVRRIKSHNDFLFRRIIIRIAVGTGERKHKDKTCKKKEKSHAF